MFQGERIEKGQGTWDPPEEPPCDVISLSWLLFFSVCTRDILQEKWKIKKKTKSVQPLQLLLYLQCYWSITCTTAFFHISILSTDLIVVGEWRLLRDYKLKGLGWGTEHLLHGIFCTFSWIALSFLNMRRLRMAKESYTRGGQSHLRTWRDVNWDCFKRSQRIGNHAETLWALIVLHIF